MTGITCRKCGHVMVRDMDGSLQLSRRQRDTLDAIMDHIAAHECTPNLQQVANVLGAKNKSRVHHYVSRLRDLGYLEMPVPGRRPRLIPTPAALELYRHAA